MKTAACFCPGPRRRRRDDLGQAGRPIWRRKELENYFVIPEYLCRSSFCKRPQDVEQKLLGAARQRLWLDIANQVIVAIREEIKGKWIETFDSVTGFDTRERALAQLKSRSEFTKKKRSDARALSASRIEAMFEATRKDFLGGERVDLGKGRWQERMSGKSLFRQLVGSRSFDVRDREGKSVEGQDKRLEVVKDLLRQDRSSQPEDFQDLYKLLAHAVR